MRSLYVLTVTIHVLAAVTWLGGMVAFALLAPVLRRIGDAGERQALFQALGERFRVVGWACITVLLVTGVGQLQMRGWWGAGFWGTRGLWSSALGHALAGKLLTVTLMLVVQAVHDFHFGPKAGRVESGTDEALSLRRTAARLARANALAGIALVYFAVRLARGG